MTTHINCRCGGVESALFVMWLILYVLGSILEYCEVSKKFSTGQIKFYFPAAAVFKRITLFTSLLLWQKGHKFQFWSTIKLFFACGTLLLCKKYFFLHFPEDLLAFNLLLMLLSWFYSFNCLPVVFMRDARIIHSSLKPFKRSCHSLSPSTSSDIRYGKFHFLQPFYSCIFHF